MSLVGQIIEIPEAMGRRKRARDLSVKGHWGMNTKFNRKTRVKIN